MNPKTELKVIGQVLQRRFVGDRAYEVLDAIAAEELERTFNHLKAIAYYCPAPPTALKALELMLSYFLGQPISRSEITARVQQSAPQSPLERFSPEALAAVRRVKEECERLQSEDVDEGNTLPPLPPRK